CFALEGYQPSAGEDKSVRVYPVSPGYFHTLGIPLQSGREFSPADKSGAPRAAIVNEAMAHYYFGDANPIGKHFAWSTSDPKNIEIVGVVKDAKYDNLRQQTPRLVYLSALQIGPGPGFIQIRARRSSRPASALIADCRAAIRSVNSNIRIVSF